MAPRASTIKHKAERGSASRSKSAIAQVRLSRQIAAVPTRRSADGELEVLLVTSRETRRWVVPKGWPISGMSDREAAAEEAWEEAGVRGKIGKRTIGSFSYDKRRPQESVAVVVDVYLLNVTEILDKWPEGAERERRWFAPDIAAELVQEPELRALLASLE